VVRRGEHRRVAGRLEGQAGPVLDGRASRGVAALSRPEYLLEVDATAVVPAGDR
jgi:hypothetical protein